MVLAYVLSHSYPVRRLTDNFVLRAITSILSSLCASIEFSNFVSMRRETEAKIINHSWWHTAAGTTCHIK
jgi:hypothetical protein